DASRHIKDRNIKPRGVKVVSELFAIWRQGHTTVRIFARHRPNPNPGAIKPHQLALLSRTFCVKQLSVRRWSEPGTGYAGVLTHLFRDRSGLSSDFEVFLVKWLSHQRRLAQE